MASARAVVRTGRMPESGSERFARSVEGEHLDLDEQLRHELTVVDALRRARTSVQLDDVTRQRMRGQLLARFTEEHAAGEHAAAAQPGSGDATAGPASQLERRRGRTGPVSAGLRGRLLVAAAAALCLLMSLSGMSLLLARDALPGDALYGFKRSAESAELGFTFGLESRGFKHLQFATARVDELEALAARTSGAVPVADTGRYLTALDAFDTDAAAGSRLLTEAATNSDGSLLNALVDWAGQQHRRITTVAAAMPDLAADRTAGSLGLLVRVAERASGLRARLACLTVTSGASDDVGPLPADGVCVPASGQAGPQHGQPGGANPPATTGPGAPGQPPVGPLPGTPTPVQPLDPSGSVAPPPPPAAPSLPVPEPTVPIETSVGVPLPIVPPLLTVPPLTSTLPQVHVG